MATKAKATQAKEDAPEKDAEGAPDSPLPLLDLNDAAVKKMIKAAKKRGYITYEQLNAVMPSEEVNSEQIEDTLAMLSEMGINVVETEDADGDEEGEKATDEQDDDDDDDTGREVVEAKSKQLLRGKKGHPRLLRRAITFALIALHTRSDKVLWCRFAALSTRQNVVERQILSVSVLAAVLTTITIADVDPGTFHRRFASGATHIYIMTQANDRRQLEAEGRGPDLALVRRDNLDLPLAPKRDSFLPVDDLEGLVRGVQKERLLHISLSHSAR